MKKKSNSLKRSKPTKNKSDLELEGLTFDQIETQNLQETITSTTSNPHKPSSPLKKSRKPAWIDRNDEEISIDISKVARLRKLRKNDEETVIKGDQYQDRLQEFYNKKLNNLDFFKWGSKVVQNEEEEEKSTFKELLNQDIPLFDSHHEELPPTVISISKAGSLLRKEEHNAVVQTLDFHPNNEFFLSGGYDKIMKIYSVKKEENLGGMNDGFRKNLKILKKVYVEGFPLKKCRFMAASNQILCSGLKKHLLSYDLVQERTEKYASNLFTSFFDKSVDNFSISQDENYIALNNNKGDLVMLSGKNKEYLFHLRCNEPITTTQFTHDSRFLFTASNSGKIYQWDLNKRAVYDCVRDVGASVINCMDLSFNDNYLAVGGLNGIVDLYDRDAKTLKLNKNPLKEVQNLTTAITDLEFNKKGEIMVISSKWKKNAIRIFHLGSRTVFSNWPNLKTKLQFVTSLKLSENCKYMALGNDEGNVFLYNFKHYN